MLKTLDILIGLAVVMLFLSMIVTVITQFLINLRNMRGRHLLTGIADLLEQISPGITRSIAEEISTAVLSHPLIRNASGGLGNVIHREELTKLLLELAANDGPQSLSAEARKQLLDTLAADGLGNPDQIKQTLQNVRSLALQLELAHPELTNAARARIAMLQQANSQFLGKINLWFDQTMDRVSERFTANTRYVTFFTGLVIAFVLQLDTAALVSRLSSDDAVRDSLVTRAQQDLQVPSAATPATSGTQGPQTAPAGSPATTPTLSATSQSSSQTLPAAQTPNAPPSSSQAAGPSQATPASSQPNQRPGGSLQLKDEDVPAVRDLMMNNILGVPQNWTDWKRRWDPDNWPVKVIGILLSAVLLSLGAPFWYNALQNLVRLRSVVASKDDQQRQERQLSQPAAAANVAAAQATADTGFVPTDERGDLAVVA
jgi:hypothetical protein